MSAWGKQALDHVLGWCLDWETAYSRLFSWLYWLSLEKNSPLLLIGNGILKFSDIWNLWRPSIVLNCLGFNRLLLFKKLDYKSVWTFVKSGFFFLFPSESFYPSRIDNFYIPLIEPSIFIWNAKVLPKWRCWYGQRLVENSIEMLWFKIEGRWCHFILIVAKRLNKF